MHRIANPNNGEFDSHMPLQTTPGYFNGRMLALHANDASSILALGTKIYAALAEMVLLREFEELDIPVRFRGAAPNTAGTCLTGVDVRLPP